MDFNSLLSFFSDTYSTVIAFFTALPDMAYNVLSYFHLWYIEASLTSRIFFVRVAFTTAQTLLQEIGFNTLLSSTFNALPDEIRYYAYLFNVPEAISVYFNLVTTALVLRLSK